MRKILIVLNAICLLVFLAVPVNAYIDPSVMTYTIQVVAGIVVAVGAVVGVYWRRVKRKVQNKLGIDENANKEIEEDIIELDFE